MECGDKRIGCINIYLFCKDLTNPRCQTHYRSTISWEMNLTARVGRLITNFRILYGDVI